MQNIKENKVRPRILFVDDEPNIRRTLPEILRTHGFEVGVAATVAEALKLISTENFDVLLSDLNIGEPGDGFTVVSAMRRIQPSAATIILTGYPAFETALKAIQSQVDDYLVKPAEIPSLVNKIRERMVSPVLRQKAPLLRLMELIRENRESILQDWLASVDSAKQGSAESFAEVLDSLIQNLQQGLENLPAPDLELAAVSAISNVKVMGVRKETDSLGEVDVPSSKLWGAQTQRSLEHFNIGKDLIPREMIAAYATLKKAAANANYTGGRLDDQRHKLIVQVCDEILAGQHEDMFPLHVWMTGSGTQFNMNVNEVISNRCCQLAGTPVGSKTPVHPNDHVNMSQSSNDSFPTAMNIAAAVNVKERLIPAVENLRDSIAAKVEEWKDVVKIGRTHMQDATPITLGEEWSGYSGMLSDNLERIEDALHGLYRLALGGTAVGTGINAAPGFGEAAAAEIEKLTNLPFISAPNKFTVQGAHDALVQLSGTLRTLAVSLYKIANDIRLMSCGPRAGFAELVIPANEPGSSIMPGKVNPTQAEALTMIAVQVMANDVAVGFGGAGGYLEMNVYKPLIIFNVTHSVTIMTDGCTNFRKFLIEGTKPNLKKIKDYVDRSLMLVTALSPVIGYDKSSKIAHYALDNDLTLKQAALKLGFVTEDEFDRVVDPTKMVHPYVAKAS